MSIERNRRILIVDDNPAIHEDFRKILAADAGTAEIDAAEAALFDDAPKSDRPLSYQLDSAFQGQEGLAKVSQARETGRPYAMAFVDMRMPPGWDGVETILKLWEKDPDLQVVIATAYSDYSREEIVTKLGVGDRLLILKKPFDNAEVAQLACALTEKWWQTQQARLKLSQLEEMVEGRTGELKHELTERKRIEEALRESEERYALAARGSNEGLWDWDLKTQVIYFSPRWKSIVGLNEDESIADVKDWFDRVHKNDLHALKTDFETHLAGGSPYIENEHRLQHKDGTHRWVLCRGIAIRDQSGRAYRVAGSLTDITSRKVAEEELRRGAFYDRLTGLPNRALLKECLDRAIERAKSDPAYRFALLFLDFDRFKVINDSLGHLTGDQLLIGIANRLTRFLSDDAIKHLVPEYTVARLGGDEFVILLDGIPDVSVGAKIAESMQAELVAPFTLGGAEVYTSASIGIALSTTGHEGANDALRDADTAMYRAKSSGRARHEIFDKTMHDQALARLEMETDLRRALERRELCLFYQPIMSIEDAKVAGFEALVRWNHPQRGLVSPVKFIPIAEETGLIVPLGRWVLDEACRQLHEWHRHESMQHLYLSVNLSRKQFAQGNVIDDVLRNLRAYALDPGCLKLEVTESVIMDDLESAIALLYRLRDMGVHAYMDDFGTGYSSLSCLRRLPLQAVKIDRAFVSQISQAGENSAIIHAIVTLARNLKMKVIAEGVETPDQLAQLLALDCELVQGYLFSKPMPAETVPGWVATEHQFVKVA